MNFLTKLLFIVAIYMVCEPSWALLDTVGARDKNYQEAIVWAPENREIAARISDWGQYGLLVGSIGHSFGISNADGWQAVGTQVSVGTLTHLAKFGAKRLRPNGSSDQSFFSGHTSAAFTGAGIFCHHDINLCLPALGIAGTVGYMRIAANKHWLSDVTVGAFIGFTGGTYLPSIFATF